MKKLLLLFLLAVSLIVFSYQWESFPGFFKPMKNLAMGGTYVTTAEGLEALLLNPALFEAGGLINLDLSLSSNVMTIAPKLSELLKSPEKITELATDSQFLKAIQGVHSYGANLYGGYGAKLLWANVGGIGAFQSEVFWNLSLVNLNKTELGAWAGYFGLIGGSLSLARNLRVGVSAGGGMAGILIPAGETKYPATVDLTNPNSLESILPDDPAKVFNYMNTPFFVLNVGAIYSWNDLSIGVAFHYNSNNLLTGQASQILSAGVSYDLKVLKLAFELEDLLNQEKSFYRKTNLGLESDFGLLKLYAGLHAGWLTGGLKLSVPFFNIAFVAHVVEFSPRAGLMGEQKYNLSFSVKF